MWSLIFEGPITGLECVVACLLVVSFYLLGKYINRAPAAQPVAAAQDQVRLQVVYSQVIDCYNRNWMPAFTADHLNMSMYDVVWFYVQLDEIKEGITYTYRSR